jgi:Stage II sporulation protein E (SpoIIE)
VTAEKSHPSFDESMEHSSSQGDTLGSMKLVRPWQTVPRRSLIIFLLAVFCVFANIGFANDIMDLGRMVPLRFWLGVAVPGVFAIFYALAGVTLRSKFWMGFIPIFTVQFLLMALIGGNLPDPAHPAQYGVAEMKALESRLNYDGLGIIIAVSLGYAGFIYVFISEGRRYLKARTEMATLEGEMTAAREVQRVMVPEHPPQIAGYSIESVYHPAAEVGGDFFQVIPLESGRALVVIGDVSGKGLRAAMIVSMIVGTLRSVSAFTEEPAKILTELNRHLCGHMQEGFATCLVVRLEGQGRLTFGNAGHLPPYVNGVEMVLAGSMPLGLNANAEYEQVSVEMAAGDSVVVLTDGIAEAQNAERELFGFERVGAMLQEGATAKNVADAAQGHGQNDDVTVLRLSRVAEAA